MTKPSYACAAEVGESLRELTANLMLVARGSGKPHRIARDAGAFVAALRDYREATGRLPSPDALSASLTVFLSAADEDLDSEMIRSALRVGAGRLTGDEHQQQLGRRELTRAKAAQEGESGRLQS